MSDILPWLEYQWSFEFPVGMYRAFCERLRGTPARLEELLRGGGARLAQRPAEGKWSVLEHAGHLLALEERLHHPRVEQYLRGEKDLLAADMSNRATEDARFNQQSADDVLSRFRAARAKMMQVLDARTIQQAAQPAFHPRLKMRMRLVDFCFFCAEHDDHHLAMIRELLR